jgi:hypothetical protein
MFFEKPEVEAAAGENKWQRLNLNQRPKAYEDLQRALGVLP